MIAELPDWPVFGWPDDVRPVLREVLASGEAAALATIVALDGGGPRPVGTQMVISASRVSGFLSGGCLEADVAGHAAAMLATGKPARLVYGEGSPWPDIRLLCGARIEVQLEAIPAVDEAARTLFTLTDARTPALWRSDGQVRVCGPSDAPPESWPGALEKLYAPVARLIVLGADPTALAIASLGAQAGFETTLIRPKGPLAPPPLASVAYSRDEPAQALAAIGLDPWTAVAVATHDAELDHAALVEALPSAAFYVGALGARRRLPDRQAMLAAAGLSPAQIGRLHAPIGLALGGKSPWDVAIAVLAQIAGESGERRSPPAPWREINQISAEGVTPISFRKGSA